MDDELLVLSEFVRQSKNRFKVLNALHHETLIPTEIAKKMDMSLNIVSKCLRELRKEELVVLLNPERSQGRLYKINDEGKRVLDYILEDEESV